MKIFGIEIQAKKVDRRVTSEDFQQLSEFVFELEKRIDTTYKAQDSLRKRFEKAKIAKNGDADPVDDAFEGSRLPEPRTFNTGDPWPG